MPTTNQFDFLRDYIQKILTDSGYDKLGEETKKEYVPQFVAHAEQRIGAALMPHLNEQSVKALAALVEKKDAKPEDWADFWQKNVPGYEEIVKKTLEEFTNELKKALVDAQSASKSA